MPVEVDRNPPGHEQHEGPVVGLTGARFGGTAGRRSRAAEDDDAVQTGTRLPSLLSRWRHKQDFKEAQHPEQQPAEVSRAQGPPDYQQGPPDYQQAGPVADTQPEIAMPVPDEASGTGWDTSRDTYDLVRPYSWTRGRTSSHVDLELETLVSATGRPLDAAVSPEHRTILGLCATPHSVAELAALLSMPLGVARVLLGDLAAAGSVAIHRTVGSADTAPDIALMQRVLAGLERL
ncbi:MAG: DUF742 domain-containing protein [Pseudonocardiaceae bacterium]